MRKSLALAALLLVPRLVGAQQLVPFTNDRWAFDTKDYALEEYLGKRGVKLKNNRAVLNGAAFENGVIDFDVAFPPNRAFVGVNFRMEDDANYEEFYLRPHQSGNPDANQYCPVISRTASWQLYYGEGYSAPVKYPFDQWFHVRLVVSGRQMEVYVGDLETPALFVSDLKRVPRSGGLAVESFLGEARFANFSFRNEANPPMKGKPKPPAPAPPGTVMAWQVSGSFAEKKLANALHLTRAEKDSLTWTTATPEPTGLLNLASVTPWSRERNTAFARLVIDSDREQTKKLDFGFSDRARVYLNDRLLFSGHDEFVSRDYRFLGTIGYYDTVYLPLKRGRNELWIAVSETTGGWGLKARVE